MPWFAYTPSGEGNFDTLVLPAYYKDNRRNVDNYVAGDR
jgi:hypothetical protein